MFTTALEEYAILPTLIDFKSFFANAYTTKCTARDLKNIFEKI